MGWPLDWGDRVSGAVCRMCDEGRPDESRTGLRVATGPVADAYLARRGPTRGYAVVIWRGRHVVEPHHLNPDEATAYHNFVLRVGRAVEQEFRPLKVNYMTLGNVSPHLHTHVTARYLNDPAPGAALPPGGTAPLADARWRADAAALRHRLTSA